VAPVTTPVFSQAWWCKGNSC